MQHGPATSTPCPGLSPSRCDLSRPYLQRGRSSLPLNILLALILLICALAVVTARHKVRTLFIQLQAVEKQQRDLETEWGRLLLEQGTLSKLNLVERQAEKELNMVVPLPGQTVILKPEIKAPKQP